MTFKRGDVVRLRDPGQPVFSMIVQGTVLQNGCVGVIWIDRDLHVQGYYFEPELLEKVSV
jgi:uncharacterized protein YodC (DUF2158 family)